MNELDKIFRSKLENHTEEYSSQSWDKIQSRLVQQKTKPKKFPWLWMSLISIIVIGGLSLLITSTDSEGNALVQSDNISTVRSSDDIEHAKNGVDSNAESSEIFENEKLVSNTSSIKVNKNKENDLTSTNMVSDTQESIVKTKQNQTRQNIAVVNASKVIIDIEAKNRANIKAPEIVVENDASLATLKEIEVAKINSDLQNIDADRMAIDQDRTIDIRPLRTIGVSSFSKLYSVEDHDEIELTQSMLEEFRQDCPSFVTDRTGVYLDFYVSHELPFSSLSAKDPSLEPYRGLRAETEGPSYSFSAGARLTLMLPNGLGLKTGFNYSQVNEKFSYVDPESIMRKQVITITTIDGMEVRDTNFIEIPGTREIVSTNKYRSFDIPLLLSYEWDVRERTYMTVNGGIYLNLLFKESGKILDPSGEVIDISDTSGDQLAIFKNNIGLSLFGSVGLHYRWNSSIDFILEPNARLLVKSATVDGYSLNHKWITAGLITGIRYNF